MPTVLWRGWSHGNGWLDLSACCVEARRSSRLRYPTVTGHFRGRVLWDASNEVGILNCAVAVAGSPRDSSVNWRAVDLLLLGSPPDLRLDVAVAMSRAHR
jgi:hypothetical protein